MPKGSCLCGAVHIDVRGAMPDPHACHCTMCRKSTGHYGVGADVPRDQVTIKGEDNVRWYQSSETVRRGFCSTCGSPLFFDIPGQDWLGINLGAFDEPTGTKTIFHIFVGNKGDYYDIADGLPQYETLPEGAVPNEG